MITRYLVIGLLSILALSLATVTVVPSLRSRAKALIFDDGRHLIAKASGRLTLDGPDITVLKILQAEKLYVEIYKMEPGNESMELMAKLPLPESRDAFFTFQGNATNLALGDLDSDGALEILVPTYDPEMTARLNVFKFDPETNGFHRLNSDFN